MKVSAAVELPAAALLRKYAAPACFCDGWVVDVPHGVPFTAYVEAFFTTLPFQLERWLLHWMAGRPSTDAQAAALACGASERFAAWRVEARADGQILLADDSGRTRTWLMVSRDHAAILNGTRLYFGSAVLPRINRRTGAKSMGLAFHALSGFHRGYSRVLLGAAGRRVVHRLKSCPSPP